MVRHPKPVIIAKQLRRLADTLDDEGARAIERAAVLAARGYPSTGSGGGQPSGGSGTSSTERAAGLPGDRNGNLAPPQFAGLDERLAKLLRVSWTTSVQIEETIGRINSHADDSDPVPAGTGSCVACGLFCRPTKERPEFRRRERLCPADYTAWLRYRKAHPDAQQDEYIRTRWMEHNPESTTDQFLQWRRKMLDAENGTAA